MGEMGMGLMGPMGAMYPMYQMPPQQGMMGPVGQGMFPAHPSGYLLPFNGSWMGMYPYGMPQYDVNVQQGNCASLSLHQTLGWVRTVIFWC